MISFFKEAIKVYVARESFNPSLLGAFVNPFWIARRALWHSLAEKSPILSGRLLDVGCGSKPYQPLLSVSNYVGLELDSLKSREFGIADYFYDGLTFPFEDNSFDSVLCNQVLEHVFNPDEFLREIYRVLKPGGKLLMTAPFVWDEHEQPYDYARYSSFGLKALLEENGFTVTTQEKICADASIIFQLTNAYLYKVAVNWNKYLRLFFAVTVMGLVNLVGLISKWILPKNPDLFLDNLIVAEKSK